MLVTFDSLWNYKHAQLGLTHFCFSLHISLQKQTWTTTIRETLILHLTVIAP